MTTGMLVVPPPHGAWLLLWWCLLIPRAGQAFGGVAVPSFQWQQRGGRRKTTLSSLWAHNNNDDIPTTTMYHVCIEYDPAAHDLRSMWTAQELLTTFRDDRALGAVTLLPQSNKDHGTFVLSAVAVPLHNTTQEAPPLSKETVSSKNTSTTTSILWEPSSSDEDFPEMKIWKQLVRNHINPTRDLGHSDQHHTNATPVVVDFSQEMPPLTDTTLSAHQVGVVSSNNHLVITYCNGCRWLLRAAYYAQECFRTYPQLQAVTLIPCRPPAPGGTLRLDMVVSSNNNITTVVWDRHTQGRFPTTTEVLQGVGAALTTSNRDEQEEDNNSDADEPPSDGDSPFWDDMDEDDAQDARRFFGVLCERLRPPWDTRRTTATAPSHKDKPVVVGIPIAGGMSRRGFGTVWAMQVASLFVASWGASSSSGGAIPALAEVTPPDMTPEEDISVKEEIKTTLQQMLSQKDKSTADEKQDESLSDEESDAIKKKIRDLISDMIRDEKEEVQTDQKTEDLAQRLQIQQQQGQAPSRAEERKTQQMITQIEKEEENVEQQTTQLIEKVGELHETAEKTKTTILPEPNAPSRPAAFKASVKETMEFISKLKERLKSDQEYVSLLEYQQKTKISPDLVQEEGIINLLKERIDNNREFRSLYDDFLTKLQSYLDSP